MPQKKIIVIGGGAAGLMAAGKAAEAGADVILLEKMKQPGRKLSITGKGRCNITNVTDLDSFIENCGTTGPFLHNTFSQYFTRDIMSFFAAQGVQLVTERGGRVFPASGKAQDVAKALINWNKQAGVNIKCSSSVSKLIIENNRITHVVSGSNNIACDAAVLTTGGASYPATGSTGDGYKLAASAGHSIIPVRPALVPLETSGSFARRMDKLNLRNIKARMYIDDKICKEQFGELVFSSTGVTGPVILTLSGDAVDAIRAGKKVSLSIDLKPALNNSKLRARIARDCTSRGQESFGSFLRGFMSKEMVPVCSEILKIPMTRSVSRLSDMDKDNLRIWLKDFRLNITGFRPFEEAIVTAGGVSIDEVNPATMESLKTSGLYIAGELLDINANTGGYNLQAAFSTGWVAGKSAAQKGKR